MNLIDTSVAVDHLRGHAPATALLERLLRSGEAVVASELTRFELLSGVRAEEVDQLEEFITVIDWVPVTEGIARTAAQYAQSYRRSHSGIDVADYLIAGTVAALAAELLTLNVRHFPMFEDIHPPYAY